MRSIGEKKLDWELFLPGNSGGVGTFGEKLHELVMRKEKSFEASLTCSSHQPASPGRQLLPAMWPFPRDKHIPLAGHTASCLSVFVTLSTNGTFHILQTHTPIKASERGKVPRPWLVSHCFLEKLTFGNSWVLLPNIHNFLRHGLENRQHSQRTTRLRRAAVAAAAD